MTEASPVPPLAGVKVVHLASLGPGPYLAMLLADMGADVTIVDRTQPTLVSMPQHRDPRRRTQRSIALDLKHEDAKAAFLRLLERADIFIEGMRPGAMERLGFGPEFCLGLNPRLIYVRMTGWGQSGPLAQTAGHDINYIALSGALHAMGAADEPPPVPLNLLGDYAGGGAFVALGVLAALYERQRSGKGQVIDGAIVDGVASLTAATMGMKAAGLWGGRGSNAFDGSAPWYRTYRTKDGRFVAVGAIEPQFYRELIERLGVDAEEFNRDDPSAWAALAGKFEALFGSHDRAHWEELFRDSDACVSPVLTFDEAIAHPHHRSRQTYLDADGIAQPAPAPRLGRSPSQAPAAPPAQGAQTEAILSELGWDLETIKRMQAAGAAR